MAPRPTPSLRHEHDSVELLPLPQKATMPLSDQSVHRRVVVKLDFILLPFLSVLFLFNSLDKSNIGSAETGDFTKDTGLPSSALNTSVAWFFAAFVTLQPVGAAFGRRYGMARYVPACMTLWGICTTLHIFVTKQWQLVFLRTLVGALEAGFYPTTVSYLSLFYTRFEFAKRLGLFYGQAAVAGAFGGLLSWAVYSQFPTTSPPDSPPGPHPLMASSGWKGWQILFLVEGLTTMVIAVIGFFWLPHNAATAWFLTHEERQCAELRILEDHTAAMHGSPASPDKSDRADFEPDVPAGAARDSFEAVEHERLLTDEHSMHLTQSFHSIRSVTDDRGLSRNDIISAIIDWKVWFLLGCNVLSAIPALAFSIFLPLVIKGLIPSSDNEGGMPPATANLLTVPPFIAGAIVLWSFTAWSDRGQQRLFPVLWGLGILLVGLTATILLPVSAYTLRYFALMILLSGSFVPSPLTVSWLTNNMIEPGKRAIVLGINGWGNLAGVLSALIFAPRYRHDGYLVPFFITLACVAVSAVGFALFRFLVRGINARRQDLIKTWTLEQREAEAMHGDVDLSDNGYTSTSWWWGVDGRTRRGDERLTFVYGL